MHKLYILVLKIKKFVDSKKIILIIKNGANTINLQILFGKLT
jgi:hypothetical protein